MVAGGLITLQRFVLVSSPLQYKVGDSVSVSAKVRDPLSELDRVAFYVNGVELDVNSTSGSGTTYSASYEFTDESAQFVTARALYGDDRDRGPSTIAEDEWMQWPRYIRRPYKLLGVEAPLGGATLSWARLCFP